ncbi:MAG TPA: glycosyltransferase family 39 protein [Thermoleophilia bacterium]|nr:glycosyltransferase family 39 protein [Thermoleophilia bacterium]
MAAPLDCVEEENEPTGALAPFAWAPVLGVAAGCLLVLMLVAGRYGYHRDELYFVAASRHMAWGYVDQPPLSVALVWVARRLFGDSLYGLRLFPALAFAAAVALAGLTARELGGRRFAQTFAALLLGVSPFLIVGHMAGPTIYDLVGWALVMLLVLRILRTGDQRLWLLVGLVVGVSLYAKHTILFLVIALLFGLIVDRRWKVLASPYLWAAAAIAILLWVPNLLWQADNGWPTLAMSAALRRDHSGAGYTVTFVILQFLLPGLWAAPVWLAGLWALLLEPRFRAYRAFAWAYLLLFVVIMVEMGDRPYYLGPLYIVLLGVGSVIAAGVVEGSRRFFSEEPPAARSRGSMWRSPAAAYAWVIVFAAIFLPLSLPVLPARWLHTVPLQKLDYNLGEEIGWQDLTATVARVYDGLPAAERAKTVVLTGNYGEAGALQRYGGPSGLPAVYSGHNNFHLWGPPPDDATTAIVVGFGDKSYLTPYFATIERAGTIVNRAGVDNDEDGLPIWVARGLKRSWSELWPDFQHYD